MKTERQTTGKDRTVNSRSVLTLPVATLVTVALVVAASTALAGGRPATVPEVSDVRLVTGAPDMYDPAPLVANLDAGNKVAGITRWDHDADGLYNTEAWVGFSWSPTGGSRAFSLFDSSRVDMLNSDWYWDWNRFAPSGVSDGGTVVGNHLVYAGWFPLWYPYLWTDADGYLMLPLPCFAAGDGTLEIAGLPCLADVVEISGNGSTAVGSFRADTSYETPEQAAAWRITRTADGLRIAAEALPTTESWARAWDVSADGSVIVGEAGGSDTALQAARWVLGRPRPLDPVGETSIARFTSADGSAAIGWANLDGRHVLVRWNAAGAASIAVPPDGMSIESIQAINPSATAAVGALSRGGPMGNWSPYLWTSAGGFTVLPELGLEDEYDASEAMDVSDDGKRVVGLVSARVTGPGSSPPLGFLWSPTAGSIAIDDMLASSGRARLGTYFASAISGDGLRILASGNPDRTEHDSNSFLIILRP